VDGTHDGWPVIVRHIAWLTGVASRCAVHTFMDGWSPG